MDILIPIILCSISVIGLCISNIITSCRQSKIDNAILDALKEQSKLNFLFHDDIRKLEQSKPAEETKNEDE
jgi:hypothetical protein